MLKLVNYSRLQVQQKIRGGDGKLSLALSLTENNVMLHFEVIQIPDTSSYQDSSSDGYDTNMSLQLFWVFFFVPIGLDSAGQVVG